MITKSTNETIMVFVTPDKLREIAGCLERQEQRAKDQTGLSLGSSLNVVEGLESLHTQLHSGEITVWFRNPKPVIFLDERYDKENPKEEQEKCSGAQESTSDSDELEVHLAPYLREETGGYTGSNES